MLFRRAILGGASLDDQFFNARSVAPDSHKTLFRCVAKSVLAVLSVERRIAQPIEKFPEAVEVYRIRARRR
jgi:hypothetical protein